MTPDQIEEAAIEAAFKVAHEKGYGVPHLITRAAIEAYNAAMWSEGAPPSGSIPHFAVSHRGEFFVIAGGPEIFGVGGAGRIVMREEIARHRPLPNPPEKP